ncbi:MAG: hypothetical protein IKX36_04070 [Prevotella sp.]|nr:hypothetical protein [Prevotella sp.]
MKAVLAALFFPLALQVMASPEDIYSIYDKDGKNRVLLEKVDRMNQEIEEAEQEKSEKKMLILIVSLLIAIVPLAVIGKQVVCGRTWKTNLPGTAQALLIACAGGFVLFAFNYGILYLKILHYEIFKYIFSLAIVIALIIGASILLRKK